MKEIGEKLKEARESIGISIEEAAEDLKLRPSQIENIESGNVEAFQDILYLKYFIRDYSKYLGLDKEEIVDEFNEYLFDYTSKLSIDDIKKEIKIKKEDANKIKSPYTMEKKKDKLLQIVSYVAIILLLLIVLFLLYSILTSGEEDNGEKVVMMGENYEFTK